MRIDILTIHKDILQGPFNQSIIKRAVENNIVEIHLTDIRDFSDDKHKRVDDYMFGGGAGMVMTIEPILTAIEKLRTERMYDEIIYLTPDAPLYEQKVANELSLLKNIIILCGHYKGVDQRLRDHIITREISIGEYVLTGGELAAAVITDSIVRLLPGAISDETSALTDSYQDGLLAPPVYTRPADYKGWKIPDILLSGHERKIEEWRHDKALEKTRKLRPDWLKE